MPTITIPTSTTPVMFSYLGQLFSNYGLYIALILGIVLLVAFLEILFDWFF